MFAWLVVDEAVGVGQSDGATPTCAAALEGHADCINALVRHGADVNKAATVSTVEGSFAAWC